MYSITKATARIRIWWRLESLGRLWTSVLVRGRRGCDRRCCLFGAFFLDCCLLRLAERGAVVIILAVVGGFVVSMPEVLRYVCRSALGEMLVESSSWSCTVVKL